MLLSHKSKTERTERSRGSTPPILTLELQNGLNEQQDPPLHSASDGCEEWGDESRMKLCREVVRSWTASAGARETGQRGNGESTSAEGRRPPVTTLEEDPSTSEVPVEGSGG